MKSVFVDCFKNILYILLYYDISKSVSTLLRACTFLKDNSFISIYQIDFFYKMSEEQNTELTKKNGQVRKDMSIMIEPCTKKRAMPKLKCDISNGVYLNTDSPGKKCF